MKSNKVTNNNVQTNKKTLIQKLFPYGYGDEFKIIIYSSIPLVT